MKTESQFKQKHLLKVFALAVFCMLSAKLFAQQLYDDFEENCIVGYDTQAGGRFKLVKNPAPDAVNSSAKCAMYISTRHPYDNIKLITKRAMSVQPFASYEAPQTIKIKIFTTAPIGTPVELQLGKKASRTYPDGTHSQYIAHTTVSGAWEELEFKFTETPRGSRTKAHEVNQMILLFNPGGKEKVKYYVDDIQGPPVADETAASKD